jgi:hypothetical protein
MDLWTIIGLVLVILVYTVYFAVLGKDYLRGRVTMIMIMPRMRLMQL